MLQLIFSALLGYLLGSLSFSIILSRLRYQDDIRRHGSGNAGMTNTLRTYGKGAGAVVFVGDFLKGSLAVLLGQLIGGEAGGYLAGFFVVIGHLFPVFFGFRGGKGVATAAGMILMMDPPTLLVLLVPFVLIILLTRYMSLASITVAGLYPVVTVARMLLAGREPSQAAVGLIYSGIIGGLVIFMHRSNIGRLLRGEESKLGKKKS